MKKEQVKEPALDRRIMKTRTAIESAFLSLLETTEYSKITISAIANQANINRKTFYLHYDSIDELLDKTMQNLTKRLVDSIAESFDWDNGADALPALSLAILNELTSHAQLETNLASSITSSEVLSMMRKHLSQRIAQERAERNMKPIAHLDILLACYLGALFGVYETWATEDCEEDLDTMVTTLHDCLSGRISDILPDME